MRKKGINGWIVVLLFFGVVAAGCGKKEDPVPFTGLVDTVGTGDDQVKVVVVKGTPYEMGKQLGTLLADDIRSSLGDFLEAVRKEYGGEVDVDWLLNGAWLDNAPYIDQRVLEEMEGLAEGSGMSLEEIRMAHMVPVVSPYACSGVVVWGEATADGHTYQLRNLDYTMDAGLQDHPVVVVYLPDKGAAHFNVAFAGYIASHTGMNANHLVFGEKGRSKSSEFPYNVKGKHFSFLFREMMYDATSLEDIVNTLTAGPLIKRYCLYFADGNGTGHGAKVAVNAPDDPPLSVWYDNDASDPVAPDVFKGVVYHTMEDDDAARYIKANHGTFDADKMIELSRLVADMGSNLMDVVYDATTLEIWVAYANGSKDAAMQKYVHIDMKKYLEY
jgi:hypothetical protein